MIEEKRINGHWCLRDTEAKDFKGNKSEAWFPFSEKGYERKLQQMEARIVELESFLREYVQ